MYSQKMRIFTLSLCALLLLGGGYTGYWFWAADRMVGTVLDGVEDWRQAGYEVSFTDLSKSGFPTEVRVEMRDPNITDPLKAWSWLGDRLSLRAAPWQPLEYTLALTGPQKAEVPVSGRQVDLAFEATRADGVARFDTSGTLRQVILTIDGLNGVSEGFDAKLSFDRVRLTLDQPERPATRYDQETALLEVLGQNITLPERFAGPLGQRLDHFSGRFRVMGPLPQIDLRNALTQWRDAGGILEVPWLKTDWGPLALKAEGTIALDEYLRPIAAFDTKIGGLSETMRVLADQGLVDQGLAQITGFGLQLFASRGDNGKPEIPLPVSAQDGEFYLGPFKVATLRPLLPPLDGVEPPVGAVPPPGGTAPPPAPVEAIPLPEPPPTVNWN